MILNMSRCAGPIVSSIERGKENKRPASPTFAVKTCRALQPLAQFKFAGVPMSAVLRVGGQVWFLKWMPSFHCHQGSLGKVFQSAIEDQ